MFSPALGRATHRSLALSVTTISRRCFTSIRHSRLVPPVAAQRHQRWFATPPPQVNISDLAIERYHALSESTMDFLLESLESLLDDVGDPNCEVEYHSGVLTLKLGQKGTYVLNKQPFNKQIWLSSPVSGPKRYDYSETVDNWLYSRDGRAMGDLLNDELTRALGREVNLDLAQVSKLP